MIYGSILRSEIGHISPKKPIERANRSYSKECEIDFYIASNYQSTCMKQFKTIKQALSCTRCTRGRAKVAF